MRNSVELKAYCADPGLVRTVCSAPRTSLIESVHETDTYFAVSSGRLKLREASSGMSLIFYKRLNSPTTRTSVFHAVPVATDLKGLTELLDSAIGMRTVISKYRETFRLGSSLVSLDDVEGLGQFVQIRVDVSRDGDLNEALKESDKLKTILKISEADLVPWSYGDLKKMYEASAQWHTKLRRSNTNGRIFLLDGASCTGKTTLAHTLAQRSDLAVDLAPRYSTRQPRAQKEPEYIFVSPERFTHLAASGAFIEYRDFDFGMSYGLPWDETMSSALAGRSAIGIIDLGNVRHVKRLLPEAVTILVNASESTIRARLLRRGYNTQHEIEERLENARRVVNYERFYDYVLDNDDDMLTQAESRLVDIIHHETDLSARQPPSTLEEE